MKKDLFLTYSVTAFLAAGLLLAGCDNTKEPETGAEEAASTEETEKKEGILYESAADTLVNIPALQKENPDIFGWLYVPGTDIDAPVLQSEEADDYYESHNAFGSADEKGALYTELANLKNMCDFNTVIHGKSSLDGEKGSFSDLYEFADPDFFETHSELYFYLEDNLLTYTIFAAYERENTSLIRTYDFTYGSGCQAFLEDLYNTRQMGKNIREGWENVSPYHFLITLTVPSQTDSDKQFVVVAVLVKDAAGTIDRLVEW